MSDVESLLTRWLKRARESSFAHYAAEERYSKFHYAIGVPAAIFAAGVGTSVFASLDTTVDLHTKIAIGMVSVLTAILTGLQTFLRYDERAERHRRAAVEYSSIRRELEQFIVLSHILSSDTVEAIRKRIDDVAFSAPNVPPRIWAIAEKRAAASDYFHPTPASTAQSGAAAVPDRGA